MTNTGVRIERTQELFRMSINYIKQLIFCKKNITLLDVKVVKV